MADHGRTTSSRGWPLAKRLPVTAEWIRWNADSVEPAVHRKRILVWLETSRRPIGAILRLPPLAYDARTLRSSD